MELSRCLDGHIEGVVFCTPETQGAALSLCELEQPTLIFWLKSVYSFTHFMKRHNISFYETGRTCR